MRTFKYLITLTAIIGAICAATPETGHEKKLSQISKGEVLTFGPSTVRLTCTFNLQATNWEQPLQGRKDQGFNIEYFCKGTWCNVGKILTQCKFGTEDDGSDLNFYGPHTRLRSLDIDEAYKNKGIGTMALKILTARFFEKSLPIKLEVAVPNLVAQHLFKKFGFANVSERENKDWGVQHWLKSVPPRSQ